MRKQPGRSSASTACDSTSPKTDSQTASNWWLSSSLIWGERQVRLGAVSRGQGREGQEMLRGASAAPPRPNLPHGAREMGPYLAGGEGTPVALSPREHSWWRAAAGTVTDI